MKLNTLIAGAATLLLATAAGPSFAAGNSTDKSGDSTSENTADETIVVSPASTPANNLFGDPAPLAAATHTMVISSDTNYVNVTQDDVVKFVVGKNSFAWNFDTVSTLSGFDLRRLAPHGMLNHAVTVYLAPDPVYAGGG